MEMVQEQINTLIKLQKIDAEIYKLNEKMAGKPAEKEALKDAFDQMSQSLKDKEDELKSLHLKRKEGEIDLGTKEKEIKKYQTQLLQIKTNKEYLSLQKEINGLKADNAVLEDSILELMEKTDKVKSEITEEKERLSAEEKKLKEETEKINQEIKNTEEKIASLEKEKSQLCPNIEKELLAQYERILKAKGELALVPVVSESCGGCHRVLPPQVISEVRMKDKIIICDFCSRLLYWPQ